MRKIILIVHTSIDGFVAGKRGEFDDFNPSPENLDFISSLTEEADAALMGRVSYQMLQSFWPDARNKPYASKSEIKYSNWFNDAQKIVLSNSMTEKICIILRSLMEIYQRKFFRLKSRKVKVY